jgi:hypothetical protein
MVKGIHKVQWMEFSFDFFSFIEKKATAEPAATTNCSKTRRNKKTSTAKTSYHHHLY